MATVVKVRRIANPRHRPRKMTAKQIRFFGTPRQKAALRAKRKHRVRTKRNTSVIYGKSGKVFVHRRRRRNVSRKRKSNPALVVTLGSMNPHKRSKNTVPATKRNRRRRRYNMRHRRRNPVARRRNRRLITAAAPVRRNRRRRRYNVRHHRRHRRNGSRIVVMRPNRRHRRRRNPVYGQSIFGGPLFGRNSLELMGGGLLGLVAAKFIPTMFPASITGGIGGSNIGRVVISGVSAVVAGWAGSKVSVPLGQGMLFGGMIQTVSIALNAFLPQIYSQLNPSLGDLVSGQFPVPQNPIRAAAMMNALPAASTMPAGGQVRMGRIGLNSTYGAAY